MVVDARKRLAPLKVLLFARRVVEDTVIDEPTLNAVPLMVPRDPVMRLVPMDEVATTLPVESVPRSDDVRLVKYVLPDTVSAVDDANVAFQLVDQPVVIVPRVEVEFAKRLRPVQVLLFARRVVEETVIDPPSETDEPLMVTLLFWSWLLASAVPRVSVPIDAVLALMFVDVAPAAKVERPPKYDARVVVAPPKMVRPVV